MISRPYDTKGGAGPKKIRLYGWYPHQVVAAPAEFGVPSTVLDAQRAGAVLTLRKLLQSQHRNLQWNEMVPGDNPVKFYSNLMGWGEK